MYLIGNGILLTLDPECPVIQDGAAAVEGGKIVEVGAFKALRRKYAHAETLDASGCVIMPGLINLHTHFYSRLLAGSPMGCAEPETLRDVLAGRSWRLDKAMGLIDCANGAYISLAECIRNGVTTVFDHHASYGCISGSLNAIAGAVQTAGVRACLAFETSERCGYGPCSEAIKENGDFIDYCAVYGSDSLKAMFGLHAPFTLSNIDLEACVEKNGGRVGFHTHVSEGLEDMYYSRQTYGRSPLERLRDTGVLDERTVLAHCVHATRRELELIARSGAAVVNLPQSNMSNAAGFAPVPEMLSMGIPVCLGTDGFTPDMLESARAYVTARRQATGKPGSGLDEAARMLFRNNRAVATRCFGTELGILKAGAAADIVITDFKPHTRFDADTAEASVIMGMSGRSCRTVLIGGKPVMLDGRIVSMNEDAVVERVRRSSDKLWERAESVDANCWLPNMNV